MRENNLIYTNLFTNMMSEGFIFIDKDGIIRIYNDVAKEVFGLKRETVINHSSGYLEEGDIVIVANNSFGYDDGNMDENSLKLLGLKGHEIEKNQPFVLVSRFKGKNLALKVGQEGDLNSLVVEKKIYKKNIKVELNNIKRFMNININQIDFPLHFVKAIGNMVILDGKTLELKFYQTYGYTARKESINDILNGNDYVEKKMGLENLQVIGKNISDIHSSETLIEDFLKISGGEDIDIRSKFEEINGLPILCTIFPVDIEDERIGAALRLEDMSELESLIRERDDVLEKLEIASKEINQERAIEENFSGFVGVERSVKQVKKKAYLSTKNRSNVLILGEKGVGKTLLAKMIHENSGLKWGDFLHLRSKTLSRELLIKKLEDSQGGTIYIDEISRLSYDLQEDIMDIINEFDDGNFRIIASSDENLDSKMIEEKFNEKLYYSINIFPIYINPLRERKLDIRPLISYLMPKISEKLNIEDKGISNEAIEIIENYSWPDNVRELINVLERALTLALGSIILTKHIVLMKDMNNVDEKRKTLKEYLEVYEKDIIRNYLFLNKGDRKKTIEELGISQSTFYEKLSKYDIRSN